MRSEYTELLADYVAALSESKRAAERWWVELNDQYSKNPQGAKPQELWPMGPASHPRVIATYRKFFFLCAELNRSLKERDRTDSTEKLPDESDWGVEDIAKSAEIIEPKIFVLDLLSGGETDDLYEFLLSLVLVPIGIKNDEAF
jgi:hypothetical protein